MAQAIFRIIILFNLADCKWQAMLYFSDKFLALFTNNTITHFTHTQVFFSQPLKNLSFEVVSLQYYCVMNKQVLALLSKQMLYN